MSQINPLEGELVSASEESYLSDPPMVINESVDPSDVIKTTQGIRMAMVKKALRQGVPELDKDASTLMQVLRDLDTAALTTRKIDVDEQQVNESERLANAQNELLRMLGGKSPFAVDLTIGNKGPVAKRVEAVLPEVVLVPDVTAQGTQPVNYDDFVTSVEASVRLQEAEGGDEA